MHILWCVHWYMHIYLSIKSNDMNMIINNNEKMFIQEQQHRARATDILLAPVK